MAGHLVLVGLMGAGKTTVGRECGRRLGRAFVDTDAEIERVAGRTVAEIFAAEGEVGFRTRERAAISEVCATSEPLVVACGGGAVVDEANRTVLRSAGTVIWLRATGATLAARVGSGTGRPLLVDDPAAVLARLAVEREPAYTAAAHGVVDVDDLAVAAVADRVLAAYSPPGDPS